jgi:glutaredoxin-like protein DUF836
MAVAPPCDGLFPSRPAIRVRPKDRAGPRVQSRPMPPTPLPDLILYGRPGCGLCDEARHDVIAILESRRKSGRPAPNLVDRNIESDPGWERAFLASIPVVELGDRRLELATSAAKVRRLLADVLDA